MAKRHLGARTVQQVLEQAPALVKLKERLKLSQECLKAVTPLLPLAMRKAVHAGPVELHETAQYPFTQRTCWFLLADNNAVASKLRQLQPLMLQYLEKEGINIQEVRVQVLPQTSYS